jgi:hypothetical protein
LEFNSSKSFLYLSLDIISLSDGYWELAPLSEERATKLTLRFDKRLRDEQEFIFPCPFFKLFAFFVIGIDLFL